MEKIDIKHYLYHGIVDWENYEKNYARESFCLEKLETILKLRQIIRPCDFETYGITHKDQANPYTYFFTYVAYHPESGYASSFSTEIKENAYSFPEKHSRFGFLLDPKLVDELTLYGKTFCNGEIVIAENIDLDKYGVGIFINPITISKEAYATIRNFIEKYGYSYDIIDFFDGSIVTSLEEEKENAMKFLLNNK